MACRKKIPLKSEEKLLKLNPDMNFFRKHEKVWKVIVIISTIALIATSFVPLLAGGLQ